MTTTLLVRPRGDAQRGLAASPVPGAPSPGALAARWAPIVIRLAVAGDRAALERLAELDSAHVPAGATLIAMRDGVAVAAMSLEDRATIADPFIATADLVAMLGLRAAQLDGGGGSR